MKTRNGTLLKGVTQATFCLLAVLSAATAQAQWRVVDNRGNQELDSIKKAIGTNGNVNNRLQDIYEQQKFEEAKDYSDNDDAPKPPESTLDKNAPSGAGSFDANVRCPKPKAGGVAQKQWQLCKELVTTELAKYKYSLAMYELAVKRQQWLDQIRKDRQQIGPEQTGRLQDNTNRLLTLLSQIDIDRQQQKTYMDAYDARISYLVAASNTLAKQALEGTKSGDAGGSGGGLGGIGSNLAGSAVGFGVLKGALEMAKTKRRHKW